MACAALLTGTEALQVLSDPCSNQHVDGFAGSGWRRGWDRSVSLESWFVELGLNWFLCGLVCVPGVGGVEIISPGIGPHFHDDGGGLRL